MTDDDREDGVHGLQPEIEMAVGRGAGRVWLALAAAVTCACSRSEKWKPKGDLPRRVVDALRAAHQVAESTSAQTCRAIFPNRCSHADSPPGVPYGPNALDGRASVADYRIECLWASESSNSVGTCEFEPRQRGAAYDRSFQMSYAVAPGYHFLGLKEPGDLVVVNDSDLPYRIEVTHQIDRQLLVRVTVVVPADAAATPVR